MKLSEVKFKPLSEKGYDGGEVEGCPIMNYHDAWMEWYGRLSKTREGFDLQCRTSQDNRARFRAMFGKPQFHFHGGHYFHGWRVDLGTCEVLVLTAKDHGTCYEVVTHVDGKKVPVDIPRVLDFMETVCGRKP